MPEFNDSPRQVRRNLIGHVFDGALWVWGMNTFLSVPVILPWIVQGVGGTGLHIGLIPFVMRAGFMFPQLFFAPSIERVRRKKFVVLIGGFIMRQPILAMAVLLYAADGTGTLPSPWLILGLLLSSIGIGGAMAPAWLDFLADTIPLRLRGRQFAGRICVGGILGIVSAPLIVPIQERFSFPIAAAIFCGIAYTMIVAGLVGLILPVELEPPRSRRHESLRHYLFQHVRRILVEERNFRTFLYIKGIAMAASGLSMSFFFVYGLERFSLPDTWTATFTGFLLVGTLAGPFLTGSLADHYGHRLSIIMNCLLVALSNLWALYSPNPWIYGIVFILLATFQSAELISFVGMSVEFSTPEERPTYIAISNTTMLPILFAAALGGLLYDWVHPESVFWLSLLLALLGALLSYTVLKEPREAPPYPRPLAPPER